MHTLAAQVQLTLKGFYPLPPRRTAQTEETIKPLTPAATSNEQVLGNIFVIGTVVGT